MFNMKDKKVEEQNQNKESNADNDSFSDMIEEEKVETESVNNETEESSNEKESNPEEDAEKELQDLINSLKEENKKLVEQNGKIKNENDTIKDRLSRTVAEYDNYRKRTTKEKEGIYTDACEDILKEIFPVLDNLDRALTVEGSIDDLKTGIEMTIKQFNAALEKLNIEEISIDGEFNPQLHNAVMHVDDEQFGKNQVVEVFQKGYKRGDKVLRYSMVKVAN